MNTLHWLHRIPRWYVKEQENEVLEKIKMEDNIVGSSIFLKVDKLMESY